MCVLCPCCSRFHSGFFLLYVHVYISPGIQCDEMKYKVGEGRKVAEEERKLCIGGNKINSKASLLSTIKCFEGKKESFHPGIDSIRL